MNGGFLMILSLALLGGMFFMTRTQKKQQDERQASLNKMKIGDKVVTIGGLHGIVSELNEAKHTVLIDCEGIVLEFDRNAIRTVMPAVAAPETPEAKPETTVETTIVEEEVTQEQPSEETEEVEAKEEKEEKNNE